LTTHAAGTFDVQLAPQGSPDAAEGISLGGMSIAKQFHGPLDGTSRGAMLTAMTEATGAAAYVAIERVSGSLQGRRGSFTLMHNGTMTRHGQQLAVTVVPGSGTGGLAGLAGTMAIEIVDKKHLYDFTYTLPANS